MDPMLIFNYSEGDFQILPVAVLLWRYLGVYHAGLPTVHDLVTGFWTPSDAEAAVGL